MDRGIYTLIENLRKHIESNLPLLNDEIELIIKKKDKSIPKIEQLLDTLLGYVHVGMGQAQFKRLNSYYASFCKRNANAYGRFYQEIITENCDKIQLPKMKELWNNEEDKAWEDA